MLERCQSYGFLFLWEAVFFFWLVFGLGNGPLNAQPQVPESMPKYRVYVPANDQGEPEGDHYYISASLLNELRKASLDSAVLRKYWSIVGAKYQCSFSLNSVPQGLGPSLTNFKAVYEINLETENATIVLPMFPIQPEATKWDGLAIQPVVLAPTNSPPQEVRDAVTPNTDTTGNQWLIHVERQKPGKHVLEFVLKPTVEQVDAIARRVFLPAIPKVADAVLDLNLSPDMPTISVEEALGQSSDTPGKLSVQLGPTEKLTLTWNDNTVRPPQTVVESEQLYLLSAQTNQIGIRVLHKFRISGGKIQQLDLVADPALTLSGNPICESSSDAVLPSFETNTPSEGLTRLVFKEPISGLLTLRVNYIFRNFSGIGVIRFPQIPKPPHRIGKCWVGIQSAPTLEFDLLPASTINLDRFKQDWGTLSDERLLAAYDYESIVPGWTLSIRARKPTILAKIRQSVLLRQNRTDCFLETSLQSDGSCFSYSFLIPESIRIERVDARIVDAASSDMYQIPVDWRILPSQNASATSSEANGIQKSYKAGYTILSVLSERPFRDKHEITVRGVIPADANQMDRELPLFHLNSVDGEEYRVDIFRDSRIVLQDFQFPAPWQKGDSLPELKTELPGGIPWGIWMTPSADENTQLTPIVPAVRMMPDSLPIRYRWAPNTPTISGRQITQVSWNINSDRLETLTTFDLLVEKGELNIFRLRYDAQCDFPPMLSPPMKVEEYHEEGTRFVLLTPAVPLSGNVQFTVKATSGSSMESVFLPRIFPAEPIPIKHYIALPSDHLMRPVQWNKNQLLPVDTTESETILQRLGTLSQESDVVVSTGPPADSTTPPVPPSPPTSENHEVLLAAGPDYGAQLNPMDNRPTVQLNDVHLHLRKNGFISGVSSFDIRGEGADHCVLVLPAPYELVSITSGGITTQGIPLSPERWRFDIWSSPLPQKIEVVFRGWISATPNAATSNDSDSAINAVSTVLPSEDNLLPMYTSNEKQLLPINLPFLESTNVAGTIWTLAMETSNRPAPTRFFVEQAQQSGSEQLTEFDSVKEEDTALPLSAREAIPGLILLDLIRLSNMETMSSVVSSSIGSIPGDTSSWFSLWGRSWWGFRRELDSLLFSQQTEPTVNWRKSLFRSSGKLPESIRKILDSTRKPEQLGQELAESYEKLLPGPLRAQSIEFENDVNRSTAFATFRMSYSENISYLFGVSGDAVRTLNVVSVPEKPTLWENEMVHWSLAFLAVSLGIFLLKCLHPRRLFNQYPFFIGHFVAILLWLLLPPGFLGLAFLPLLWLAMLWPSWSRFSRNSN